MNSAALVDFGRQFYDRGWMEGTGGNLSLKLKSAPLEILITPSGVNKGYLKVEDLIEVTEHHGPGTSAKNNAYTTHPVPSGARTNKSSFPGPLPISNQRGPSSAETQAECADVSGDRTLALLKPSYETPIHQAIYHAIPDAGAVFHVHPVYAVVLSRLYGHVSELRTFPVPWLEIIKAIGFPEGRDAEFPILPNWQDVTRVGTELTAFLKTAQKPVPGFILYNHGLTVWGKDAEEARNHLEVMEYVCKILYQTLRLKNP